VLSPSLTIVDLAVINMRINIILLISLILVACAGADNPRYKDNASLERPPEMPIDKQAAEQSAASEIEKPRRHHGKGLKSDVYKVENADTELWIKRSFDESWSLLLQAIQHNDLKVSDQDRSKGFFYVAYDGGSLLGSAVALFGDELNKTTYLIRLEPQGEETKLTTSLASKDEQANLKGKDGSADLPDDKSSKLLELLFDTLHDSVKDE
jgi:uncharacterized lipoprotein